jgi:hypothetical protein
LARGLPTDSPAGWVVRCLEGREWDLPHGTPMALQPMLPPVRQFYFPFFARAGLDDPTGQPG